MSLSTFAALLSRDAHVARRNFFTFLIQTLLQPMLLTFVFGRVMTQSGFLPPAYKSLLLPGIIALSMILSGVQAVAMPTVMEFVTKEIEDRLLAPIAVEWFAVERIVAGMIQALLSGLIVVPTAWLVMGRDVDLSFQHPFRLALLALLVASLSSALGLVLGCKVGPTQIGLMFTLVLGPMIFFGCTYYPWSALAGFPILQKLVLLNPVVYAAEGFRSVLVPQFPHLPTSIVFTGLGAFDAVFVALAIREFRLKALS